MIYSITSMCLAPPQCELQKVELDLAKPCSVVLTAHPGATRVGLVIYKDQELFANRSIELRAGESCVTVSLALENGILMLNAGDREVLFLPLLTRFLPKLVRPSSLRSGAPAELVLLIDSTMLALVQKQGRKDTSLLGVVEQTVFQEWLISVVIDMAECFYQAEVPVQFTFVQFGDTELNQGRADDLKPAFLVKPDLRKEKLLFIDLPTHENVRKSCSQLLYSNGGDYVDGVAESLSQVAQAWSGDAFKALILIGDSPAYSLRSPIPALARVSPDIAVRDTCIEDANQRLLEKGVMVSTLFVESEWVIDLLSKKSTNGVRQDSDTNTEVRSMTERMQSEVVQSTMGQYQSQIASRTSMHTLSSEWDPQQLFKELMSEFLFSSHQLSYPTNVKTE